MPRQLNIYDVSGQPPPYKDRHQDDFYQTPARLTEELLKRVSIWGTVLEPCAGDLAIFEVLKRSPEITNITATDISWRNKVKVADATTKEYWAHYGGHDFVVTNPPFNQAHLILPLALEHCKIGVAFLLRATYTEPCQNRSQWLIDNSDRLRYRIEINPRPQFRSDRNTDSVSCVWLVWLKHWSWIELAMQSPFGYITNWKD